MNGRFKATPDDFEVEEIPAYGPSGEGEHLFLWVQKRGVSTPEAAKVLTRHAGLSERDISWAGLKDKQAVTRQFFSITARAKGPLANFAHPNIQILKAELHRNKLKNGHLKGNHFKLVVRDVVSATELQEKFDRLVRLGLPNFFGEQRFGAAGTNAEEGKRLLLSKGNRGDRFQRKLLLSAYQSHLFNILLERRIAAGTWNRALMGDVLKKHESGGEFVCTEPDVDQPRVDAFEVSPTGPLYGPKMRAAEAVVGGFEQALLDEEQISLQTFDAGRGETLGARRLFRVQLKDASLEVSGSEARLAFTLPSGSYATVVLKELGASLDDSRRDLVPAQAE